MDNYDEITNEIKEEDSFGYLEKRKPDKPEPSAKSQREYWILKTCNMLGVPFKTVLWKTINWPTDWIAEYYNYCMKEGDPPAKMWWGLMKWRKDMHRVK
jgi:hypothetical protein